MRKSKLIEIMYHVIILYAELCGKCAQLHLNLSILFDETQTIPNMNQYFGELALNVLGLWFV